MAVELFAENFAEKIILESRREIHAKFMKTSCWYFTFCMLWQAEDFAKLHGSG